MFTITERLNAYEPSPNDPIAQAMSRHSGIYDLRRDGVLVFSSNNLKHMRKTQAKYNTAHTLDAV